LGNYESLPTVNDDEVITETPIVHRTSILANIKRTTQRIKPLVIPYMAPLFLVYVSEYTINQGITPTLLFPLSSMPFKAIRDAYPTYQTLYQLGVFLSRSSSSFIRIHNIYIPSIIQFCILCFLILQSLFVVIPSIYPLFVIIFCEGILGGLVYVNAFHEVQEREHVDGDREFALGAGMAP
jgi:battenin